MATTINRRAIHAPQLLGRLQRVRDTLLTGAMWAVYAYLWLPLISLLAWLVGVDFAYDAMVRAGGIVALQKMLQYYAAGGIVIFVIIAAWSTSQRIRFRGKSRRSGAPQVSDEMMRRYWDIDEETLARLRKGRVAVITHDGQGRIDEVAVRR